MRGKKLRSLAVWSIVWTAIMLASSHIQGSAGNTVPPDEPLPKELMGTWRITEILIDTGTPRWLHVQYNDPNYMGSLLYISPQRMLAYIGIGYSCQNPRMIVQQITAGELFKRTMGGRPEPPIYPTPRDYGLPFPGNEVVTVMWVKNFGGWADYLDGTWILCLPDGRLAMCWADSSVVILSRAPADTKPVASFDCAKARTAAEKTICGSMELAMLDRDVASWYTGILQSLKNRARLNNCREDIEAIKKLTKAQKAWLPQRDKCGADAECLANAMDEQSEFLSNFEIP